MKYVILLAASCSALLAGCAAETQADAQRRGPEETYVATGTSIARRNVDRSKVTPAVSKEALEDARLIGGGALNLPQN